MAEMFPKNLHKVSKKMLGKTKTGRIEGVGWAWMECCSMLDHGLDPRNVEMPAVLAKMQRDFKNKNGPGGSRLDPSIEGS